MIPSGGDQFGRLFIEIPLTLCCCIFSPFFRRHSDWRSVCGEIRGHYGFAGSSDLCLSFSSPENNISLWSENLDRRARDPGNWHWL